MLLKRFGAADQIGQEFAIDVCMPLILGKVSFVVGLQKNLQVSRTCTQYMNKGLKDRNTVL